MRTPTPRQATFARPRGLPVVLLGLALALALAFPVLADGTEAGAPAPGPSPVSGALAPGRAPVASLSAVQQHYLTLAQAGVAQAEQRWRNPRLGWYDERLGDRERYPLATIWGIVPLFESLDAISRLILRGALRKVPPVLPVRERRVDYAATVMKILAS